jgi:hypothetical protein
MVMLIKEAQNNWLLKLFGASPSSRVKELWQNCLEMKIREKFGQVFFFVNAVLIR